MTLTVTDIVAGPYTLTGGVDVLPYDFLVYGSDEIEVVSISLEVETVVSPGDYTVQINTNLLGQPIEGGTVTYDGATGQVVELRAKPAETQEQVFTLLGFRPPTLNEGFDRAALRTLRLAYDLENGTSLAYALRAEAAAATATAATINKVTKANDPNLIDNLGLVPNDPAAAALNTALLASANTTALGGGLSRFAVPDALFYTASAPFAFPSLQLDGPGRLVMSGIEQPAQYSFITNDVAALPSSRDSIFAGLARGVMRRAYQVVTAINTAGAAAYVNLATMMDLLVRFSQAGFNTSLSDHATGRSGDFMQVFRSYFGGQGDHVIHTFFLELFSNKAGATHFLAAPAGAIRNGGVGAVAGTGMKYIQAEELIMDDGTTPSTMHWTVTNMFVNNTSTAQYQFRGGWSLQSSGANPVDFMLRPAGLIRSVIDTAAWLPDATASWARTQAGTWWYPNAVSTADPLGLRSWSQSPGVQRMGYQSGAWRIRLDTSDALILERGGAEYRIDPTAWVTPALTSPWVAHTTQGQAIPSYRRSQGGRIVLKGDGKGGGVSGDVLFTLPPGFRSGESQYFQVYTAFGPASILINAAGNVVAYSTSDDGTSRHFSLDGITFDPA